MSKYNNLLKDVITEARQLNIPVSINVDPNILINTRAKGRFGQCKKRGNKFTIEISFLLEQTEDHYIKQTIAHELLHTCPDCFNHQSQWQQYSRKMNKAYGYDISRTNTCDNLGIAQTQKQRNYVIVCQGCKREIVREKM